MASKQLSEAKLREIEEIAEGWGKLLAREAFPNGPGLDVTLADMEEIAASACRRMVQGAVETMTGEQAERFAQEEPCPTCGRVCEVQRSSRRVPVRGGTATLEEPVAHCPTCRRDFFPQRPVLKIDAHGYSPTILHRVLHMAGVTSSFDVAAVALKGVGEISISDRQITKLTAEIGGEMAEDRRGPWTCRPWLGWPRGSAHNAVLLAAVPPVPGSRPEPPKRHRSRLPAAGISRRPPPRCRVRDRPRG